MGNEDFSRTINYLSEKYGDTLRDLITRIQRKNGKRVAFYRSENRLMCRIDGENYSIELDKELIDQ
ncbi:MAG: hypothetical protein Q6363_006340, partial [Candidatus Njordarchaeota archaeon]